MRHDHLEATRQAAAMWGLGGRDYDEVSFAISDALAHAAQRLNARSGQAILDVATGTGWSARNAARRGARVTAIDVSAELLAAARQLSAHVRPPIEFRRADAADLPFADGSFDGVISTFGVIFALDQQAAARELGRVCRPGARLALTAWAPGGTVARFFAILAEHAAAPPPAVSPLAWGDPDTVRALLAEDFELAFEPGEARAFHDDADDIWDWYALGFGPMRQVLAGLDAAGRERLRADLAAYHGHYAGPAGLCVRREYLAILGRRR
ncbi:MAG: class I SAM-dependent methyltransferase [Geminicoccaceae bacterium]